MTIPYQSGRDSTVAQLLDTNIDITTLANNDTLIYNSTTQQWENGEGNPLIGLESSTATIGNPFDDTYTKLTFTCKNDRTRCKNIQSPKNNQRADFINRCCLARIT